MSARSGYERLLALAVRAKQMEALGYEVIGVGMNFDRPDHVHIYQFGGGITMESSESELLGADRQYRRHFPSGPSVLWVELGAEVAP